MITCPAGTFSGEGWGNCSVCRPGMISSTRSGNCTECEAGKFSNSDRSACNSCPAGKYSGSKVSTCYNCTAGYFSSKGAIECTPCASGYATHKEGSSSCTICEAGYRSSAVSAAWNCTRCSTGRFSAISASTECTKCDAGKYMAPSRTQCTFCNTLEPGLYSDQESNTCAYCSKGYYRTVEDKDKRMYRDCSMLYNLSKEDPFLTFLDARNQLTTYDGSQQCRCVSCEFITDASEGKGTSTKGGAACGFTDSENLDDSAGFEALQFLLGSEQYRSPESYNWFVANSTYSSKFVDPELYKRIGPTIENLILKGSTATSAGGYYRNHPQSARLLTCANMAPAPCWPPRRRARRSADARR